MKTITLICVGKLKEAGMKLLEKEYLKRLSAWVTLDIKELKEVAFDEKSNKQEVLDKEAMLIEKHFASDDVVIALDRVGDALTSEVFSQSVSVWLQSYKRVVFVIGGPLGLSPSILKKARYHLSLSSLTFTHQFARILLEEQLYRAFTILQKKHYHY